jgi:hypothetical protein
MPIGMVLRSVDIVNAGETAHATPVSFLSEMASAMALGKTGDIKTAIKAARQQIENGFMTGGVPVDLMADPNKDKVVKALVDAIRTSAGNGGARTAFIAALSNDLKDGSASSVEFKAMLTTIKNDPALDSLDDDNTIDSIVTSYTSYTPPATIVVSDGVYSGITASKTMFSELRTQALALTDYQKSGTPGFFDTKALEVEAATRDVVGPDVDSIVSLIDGMSSIEQHSENIFASNNTFKDAILLNNYSYKITVTKTSDHHYTYVLTNPNNTAQTYSGTISWNQSALTMNGDVPTTDWVNSSMVHGKMNANITGTIATLGATDSIGYNGTVITYAADNTKTSTFTLNSAHYKLTTVTPATNTTPAITVAEPLDFDGKFEMKTYTLTGKITASNYVNTDDHGKTIHVPESITFDGKAFDSTDGSYISGLVTGTAASATALSGWLYNATFTGELNVPNRPLTKIIFGYADVDANKANISLTYLHDLTKITGAGVVAKHGGNLDGTNKYTATLKNQVGVTINVLGNVDGTVSGSVLKDTTAIGTIDMLKSVPRVKYLDGTFETFL